MSNNTLTNAKRAKNDEFYTQYSDIQKEIEAYLEYDADVFCNKVIYCNCDDPFESNFFRYFVLNFKKLGLKKLITTSYKPSPIANKQLELFGDNKTIIPKKGRPKVTANKFIISDVGDINGDGDFSLQDVAQQLQENKNNEWTPLDEDGDFRSNECIELLKQADVIVTNPPFSLFRPYIKQLFDYNKKFIIIGNMNAITFKEIFPLIKENRLWLGAGKNDGRNVWYQVPNNFENFHKEEDGKKYAFVAGTIWFTNLDHGRLHKKIPLMNLTDVIKFSTKKPFISYDNYDAIDVPLVKNIPNDYDGVMGVPISFLGKYSPEQFEILGTSDNGLVDNKYKKTPGLTKEFVDDYYKAGGTGTYKEGNPTAGYYENGIAKMAYKRILIKHKK